MNIELLAKNQVTYQQEKSKPSPRQRRPFGMVLDYDIGSGSIAVDGLEYFLDLVRERVSFPLGIVVSLLSCIA